MVLTTTQASDGEVSIAKFTKLSIASLQDRHRDILTRLIANVLSSPIAEVTYGQVIDGLPLSSVARDTHHGATCPGHPLLDEHFELSPAVELV
jgi:hypothetical protein